MNAGCYIEKIAGNNSVVDLHRLVDLAGTDRDVVSNEYVRVLTAVDRRLEHLAKPPPAAERHQ